MVDAAAGQHKMTPLHYASKNAHTDLALLLIENGADLNARDRHQNTPLDLASRNGHKFIVDVLIEKGAALQALQD